MVIGACHIFTDSYNIRKVLTNIHKCFKTSYRENNQTDNPVKQAKKLVPSTYLCTLSACLAWPALVSYPASQVQSGDETSLAHPRVAHIDLAQNRDT